MKECVWTFDDLGQYFTACGHSFLFNDGTPSDNSAEFCLYCGGKLIDAAMAVQEKEHG